MHDVTVGVEISFLWLLHTSVVLHGLRLVTIKQIKMIFILPPWILISNVLDSQIFTTSVPPSSHLPAIRPSVEPDSENILLPGASRPTQLLWSSTSAGFQHCGLLLRKHSDCKI